MKVDTGADVSVLNYESFKKIGHESDLAPCKQILRTPNGILNIIGVKSYRVRIGTKYVEECFYIMCPNYESANLLSRQASINLGIVKFLGSVEINQSLFGFGEWQTEPVSFHMKDDVVPFRINVARNVPIPMLKAVKNTLGEMVDQNIIEPVTTPTDWCSPMVPVPKTGGKVRITVDFRQLNKGLKRETFHIPLFEELSYKLCNAKVMSKLDAASGFFQIPLAKDAQNLTTFLTPFGRFRFKRLPMGVNIAPEIYQRKMSTLLDGLDGVIVYMDDILIFGETEKLHDEVLKKVLSIISRVGLKLNKEKCIFNATEVEFLGHTIGKFGISVSSSKVETINELLPPKNVKELQRFLGMVNFLTKYISNAQVILAPLNQLLRKDVAWIWDHVQKGAFERIKLMLSEAPILSFFDPKKPTIVNADASSYGMGGVLLQKHEGIWRPVAFCSRALSDAEKNYAQIERECLSCVFACEKFSMYLVGLEFELQTDHKPLITLINKKSLAEAPIRVQRLLMRLARYSPTAKYVPGKYMLVSDALSRSDFSGIAPEKSFHEEINIHVIEMLSNINISGGKLEQITREQNNDATIRKVIEYTFGGWPESKYFEGEMQSYFRARGDLSMCDNCLIFRNRIVIPASMQSDILAKIHLGHLSLDKCRKRIVYTVWWPTISSDIVSYIDRCNFCQIHRRKNKAEPMKASNLPQRPWQKLGADLFELEGKMYLVIIDYFSRWIEVEFLKRSVSETVVKKMLSIFARFGVPDIIRTDGGPQFSCRYFRNFTDKYDIEHQITDPYMSQVNGSAERAVQVAKRLMRTSDPADALMAYRSTPVDVTGVSPAELLLGRKIKTQLPILPSNLQPRWPNMDEVRQKDMAAKLRSEKNYNRTHGARPLPTIEEGKKVRMRLPKEKKWSAATEVVRKMGDRSYIVRNRNFLQEIPDSLSEGKPSGGEEVVGTSRASEGEEVIGTDSPIVHSEDMSDDHSTLEPIGYRTRYGRVSNPVKRYGITE